MNYEDDAADVIRRLLRLYGVGFRKRLDPAVRLAGRQLELLKPAIAAVGAEGTFVGSVAAAPRGTILIVLADAVKVFTIQLLPAPGGITPVIELLDGVVVENRAGARAALDRLRDERSDFDDRQRAWWSARRKMCRARRAKTAADHRHAGRGHAEPGVASVVPAARQGGTGGCVPGDGGADRRRVQRCRRPVLLRMAAELAASALLRGRRRRAGGREGLMQIWFFPFVWKPPLSLAEDRAKVQQIPGGKIRLEATGRNGAYSVELDREEAERIAELIGAVPAR
jgi:hypothetical protein